MQYLLRHSHTGHIVLLALISEDKLALTDKGGSYQGRYNGEISTYLVKPVYIQLYISERIHGGYLWKKSS